MYNFLQFLDDNLGNNYGLAIIVITLIVRLIIFPFMMNTYKNQMMMREKMKIVKPEMEAIQKKVKVATTQEEKMEAQQEKIGRAPELQSRFDIVRRILLVKKK